MIRVPKKSLLRKRRRKKAATKTRKELEREQQVSTSSLHSTRWQILQFVNIWATFWTILQHIFYFGNWKIWILLGLLFENCPKIWLKRIVVFTVDGGITPLLQKLKYTRNPAKDPNFEINKYFISCCTVAEPDKVLVGELNKWVANPLGPGQTSALQIKTRSA